MKTALILAIGLALSGAACSPPSSGIGPTAIAVGPTMPGAQPLPTSTPGPQVVRAAPTATDTPPPRLATPSPMAPPPTSTATSPPTVPPTRPPATARPAPAASFPVAFPALPQLERPLVLVEVPGQRRLLVALQEGRVLSFANDPAAAETTVALDQRAKTLRAGNEEGLLGLVLDPDFPRNGFAYVYYSADRPRRTVLARLTATGTGAGMTFDRTSELVLLEVPQPYANHNGGQIAFGPDRMLYVALGDGGSAGDPHGNGQNRRVLLGKILRLDVRNATKARPYAIPPDNPFAGASDGARPEIWAYGLRNPWRFSFDRLTGRLWAGDVGQSGFEEVDLVEKGKNYGWSIMEGKACFKPTENCPRIGLTLPVVDYPLRNGRCSVVGGYVYRGNAVPALSGIYVYADFCLGGIWAFDAAEAARGAEPTVVTLRDRGPQIASFAEDLAGELYVLSFDGKIYRVVP